MLHPRKPTPGAAPPTTPAAKVALFRSLFQGRGDVYPRLWVNARTRKKGYAPVCRNEWAPGICEKPRVKCGDCPSRAFLPVTDRVILDHLQGRQVIGLYPLLEDGTCFLLAVDFDKASWREDAVAFAGTCRSLGLDPAVERSRSGNGAHVWLFFRDGVEGRLARQLGAHIITETMARRPRLSMESYDRVFPSQDTIPRGGLGNLIALPLEYGARQMGNTVFVDENMEPYPDPWRFLASLERIAPATADAIVKDASRRGRILGVRCPQEGGTELETPWLLSPSRRQKAPPLSGPLPAEVKAVLSQKIFVEKEGLEPAVLDRIQRLAAFQNPEFYKRQRLRLSTYLTPRIIACAEHFPRHLALPRGCLPDLESLIRECGSRLALDDRRTDGAAIDVAFRGELTSTQKAAAAALLDRDTGVFVAPPGAGKTVVATYLISRRGRSTLILVHRRPLLDQWTAQLGMFLGLSPKAIGQIGGGKQRRSGAIDVAMIQSLLKAQEVADLVAEYGHVILDECHHVPAVSFEKVLSEAKARYLTGLTATLHRRDGQHPIIEMQLGPVRFKVHGRDQAASRPFAQRLVLRETAFQYEEEAGTRGGIQAVYRALAADGKRNELIVDDVIGAVHEGRSPLVLTERREHLELLAAELRKAVRNVVVLKGGGSARRRKQIAEELAAIEPGAERLLLATGRYIGEGFDDPRLDTLFLAMPVAWKGTLVQYAGRLHRLYEGKREVRIVDYADRQVPVLARMLQKRLKVYGALGYSQDENQLWDRPAT